MPEAWEQYLADNEERHIEELLDFLRIPSISALPERQADVRRAADWVADQLRQAGVPVVELLPTPRNPVVFGHWHVDDNQPTAMIYGHYDVQPPDPLDLWTSPPFEPRIENGRIYARGASDDKGNTFVALKAVEALAETEGKPPINLKFFIEGEEEIGSPSLPPIIRAERERLACDFVISADGSQYGPNQPSLTLSNKGLAACQVNLTAANSDLHSGQFGAAVPNAVQRLIQLAATFHTPDNRVAVEGFYDKVRELSPEDRADIARVPFDEEEYRAGVGVDALWGEPGYSVLERVWTRPTLDFNGFWGGFQGDGLKTVTPREAHAKITCRLVPEQRPDEIIDLIEAHVRKHAGPGVEVTIDRFEGSAHPFGISRNHPALETASQVLRDLYGKEPLATRTGGTVPVAATFQQELGADMVFFAFGLPDSKMHAPNEEFRLESFRRGERAYCAYLNALAR